MRILFLSRWFPYPPDNGSKLRVYSLLRGLAACHEVTLLSFFDDPGIQPDAAALRSVCREVRIVHRKAFQPYSGRALAAFLSPTPRSVVDTHSPEMESEIRALLATGRFDLIVASQRDTAAYADCFGGVPALFEEVEIGVLYERYAAARSALSQVRNYLTWLKEKRYLACIARRFGACTTVSENERQLLSRAVRSLPVTEVIPNCVRLSDYSDVQAEPQPNRLIFTGSFQYHPNYEAMVWFLREVYPLVCSRIPGLEVLITGDNAGLSLPPAPGVTLTGRVDDVRPLVASAWLSLAPIFTGGGTRLKILEAMALSTPVVATSKGAEGLDVEPGRHLLVADTPESFAAAVLRVLKNPPLRRSLAQNALELLSEKYEWSAVMPRFLGLAERVARS